MAVSQEELYSALDLELSWSESALPEHVRTKHVHRLHPYHGKFIPQLVEVLLDRYFERGAHVLDPFVELRCKSYIRRLFRSGVIRSV